MKKAGYSQSILYVVTALLLIINVALILQNLELRSKFKGIKPLQAKEGEKFGSFRAINLSNEDVLMDFSSDKESILLFLSTTCGYCRKQMPYWTDLVAKVDKGRYRITAITTETDNEAINGYIDEYKIYDWEILKIRPDEALAANLTATPTTIVLDKSGRVVKVWTGLWQTGYLNSVSEYFSVEPFKQ